MPRFPYRLRQPLLALTLAILAGCGSLPDLRPLADATAELQNSTALAGSEVSALLTGTCRIDQKDYECRKVFDTAWDARVDALGAIADYTDALAQIAEAGESGAASAEQVGNAVNELLGVFGQSALSAPVVDAAKKLYGEVARVRAMRSMADAVDAATPIASSVISLLQADVVDLARIVKEAAEAAETEILGKEQYNSVIRARAVVTKESESLMASVTNDFAIIGKASRSLASLRSKGIPADNACATESDCTEELRSIERSLAIDRKRLDELGSELDRVNRAYAPVQAELEAVKRRRTQQLVLLAQLNKGLGEWLSIHRSLGSDLRQGLQPNLRKLLQTAAELQTIVDEMRSAS